MIKMARGQELDSAELAIFEENNMRFVNAHASVMIYGSKEVIAALSDYYNTSGDPRDPTSRDAYIALVQAMRHDSDAEDYGAFGSHVDNILISGLQRRQQVIKNNAAAFEGYGRNTGVPPSRPESG